MTRKRRRLRIEDEIRARLYRGQEPDDTLLAWLAMFDAAPFGTKQQAIKDALLRGIGQTATAQATEPVSIDADTIRTAIEDAMATTMVQIRRVVEAGVNSALQGFTGNLTAQPPVERTDAERAEIEELMSVLDGDILLTVKDD